MKKRIFISYDYENDRHYRSLLSAWNKNNEFDFEFYDGSLNVAVDSENATYVKSIIKPKILRSTHLLCIVGAYTHNSDWVDWEIEKAIEGRKKLIAVKLGSTNKTPPRLYNVGAKWALSFTFEAIKKAVDEA